MRAYKCHKTVMAGKITAAEKREDGSWIVAMEGGAAATIPSADAGRFRITEQDMGYYVMYEDGYVSWSPTAVFEDGYTCLTDNIS